MRALVILLIVSGLIHAISTESSHENKTITFPHSGAQLNFSFSIKNEHSTRTDNRTTTTARVIRNESDTQTPLFNKINQLIETQKENLSNASASFFNTYKWHLLAAALAGSYAYVCYYMLAGNNYLNNHDLWSSWRSDLPLDQLLAIPQAQFAQELLREIQRRYTDAHSITDLVRPLAQFMARIEQEEETLKSYHYYFSWLLFLRMDKLVPISTIRFTKIPERLQRLAYYKNVFQSWAADYQLEQTQKNNRQPGEKTRNCLPSMASLQAIICQRLQLHWKLVAQRHTPAFQ